MDAEKHKSTQTDEPAPPPGYLLEQTVADFLDKEIPTLRQWASRRKGPPRTNAGRRILYPEKKFFEWLEGRTVDYGDLRGAA